MVTRLSVFHGPMQPLPEMNESEGDDIQFMGGGKVG